MSDTQKGGDVTIYDASANEFLSCDKLRVATETDVLDKGHPYLEIP